MPPTFGLNKKKLDKMESLDSLILKLSDKYRYTNVRWLSRSIQPDIGWGELDLLWRTSGFEALAELTKVDVDTLYDHTLHSLLASYYGPAELVDLVGVEDYDELPRPLWPRQGVLKYTRYRRRRWGQALCPQCWAEDRSIMLPWSLLHVTTCSRHNVLLVDRCTECGEPLGEELQYGRCSRCKIRLERMRTLSIEGHSPSRELRALIYGSLGYYSTRRMPATIRFAEPHHPLRLLSPPDLMRFLYRFGQILMLRDPESPLFGDAWVLPGNARTAPYRPQDPWDLSGELGVADIHNVLTGVSRLLFDWPDAWHTTLDRLVRRDGRRFQGRLPQILREEFGGPEWDWLNNSWEDFVEQNARGNIALQPWLQYYRRRLILRGERSDVLSPRQAARQLGVKVERFKAMIEQGVVEATPRIQRLHPRKGDGRGSSGSSGSGQPGKRNYNITLVTTNTVRRMGNLRRSELTLIQAAARLGVSEATARDLVASDTLARDGIFTKGMLASTLDTFLESVFSKTEKLPNNSGEYLVLTLEQASRLGTYYGPTKAKLITAAYHGLIRAFSVEGEIGLQALRFYESDVQQFALFEPQPDGRIHIARSAVLKALRCTYETLDRYQKLGLLTPVESSVLGPNALWRYDSQDVETFQQRYVKTAEAAALMGCDVGTLRELARAGNVPSYCVAYIPEGEGGNYLFVREALVEWAQDRISTREAAELLGVSIGTVREWAIDGKLTRIGPLWLSRQQVMERVEDCITSAQALEILGISLQTLRKWVHAGKLSPVEWGSKSGKWWKFSKSALLRWQEDAKAEFFTSAEAAAFLQITLGTLCKWVRLGNITPAKRTSTNGKSWLFSRRELREWREARMSANEVIEALGISIHMWDYWRETGKIVPMEDGFVGRAWFSREAVMQLRHSDNTSTT